ncbi:Phosphoglycolate phosphatase [Alphaproteobacteria bacterium SO-S41]|nr:Phosphoglycolate phosphatase [Alphaproteobacteria bacterium SO-S41]
MQKLSLVFDLDGTLVDTAPDLSGAMNAVLRAHGRVAVPDADVRHMVGRGARALLERGFAATGAAASTEALDGYFDEFIAYYGAHIADGSVPFAGAREALARFQAEGHSLAICTNKPEALSRNLLDALDLTRFFGTIVGADTLPTRKPDPLVLLKTIELMGGDPKRAVMIGDSEVDAETARMAGVKLVIFTFGYSAFDPATFGANALIHGYDELPGALAQIAATMG